MGWSTLAHRGEFEGLDLLSWFDEVSMTRLVVDEEKALPGRGGSDPLHEVAKPALVVRTTGHDALPCGMCLNGGALIVKRRSFSEPSMTISGTFTPPAYVHTCRVIQSLGGIPFHTPGSPRLLRWRQIRAPG